MLVLLVPGSLKCELWQELWQRGQQVLGWTWSCQSGVRAGAQARPAAPMQEVAVAELVRVQTSVRGLVARKTQKSAKKKEHTKRRFNQTEHLALLCVLNSKKKKKQERTKQRRKEFTTFGLQSVSELGR